MKQPPLDVRYFGAVGDGVCDDTVAINTALAQGREWMLPVLIPAGFTFAYSDVLHADSVHLMGQGETSVLWMLNPARSAVFVEGDGTKVTGIKFDGVEPPQRIANYEVKRICALHQATNFLIDRNSIVKGAGNAIYVGQQSSYGRITRNYARDVLADSCHITSVSHHIVVEDNVFEHCGDDGVAVVSPNNADDGPCHHIEARRNVIRDQWGGRGMTVVGGSDVLYENNQVFDNRVAAGLLVASESAYDTQGCRNVTMRHNLIYECGDPSIGHFAVLIYGRANYPTENVCLQRNIIISDFYAGIDVRENTFGILLDQNAVAAKPQFKFRDDWMPILNRYVGGPVGVLK